VSAAFTKTFSTVIKLLNTVYFTLKANCFILQVKPLYRQTTAHTNYLRKVEVKPI